MVVLPDGRRRAIEVEFAVKHTRRLQDILRGYDMSGVFAEVLWLVELPALQARLRRLIATTSGSALHGSDRTAMYVVAYAPGDEARVGAAVARAIPRVELEQVGAELAIDGAGGDAIPGEGPAMSFSRTEGPSP